MTAAIVYLSDGGAHLFTDGAMNAPDGHVVARRQKAHILAHLSAAYVARGPDMFSGLLAVVAGQAQGDFDALADSFPGMCQSAHQTMLRAVAAGNAVPGDPMTVDAVLVGYSEARGFCAYTVSSYADEGFPAWSLRPFGGEAALAYASPMDDTIATSLRRDGVELWAKAPNIEQHGLAVMRAQRATGIVGGFCQMTTILRSGVFSTVLERWPDQSIGGADGLR